MTTIELTHTPSVWHQYYRALLSLKRGHQTTNTLPTVNIKQSSIQTNLQHLHQYYNLCNTPSSKHLPVIFPHILAFPLHMEILLHPHFPFPLPGLIHIKNNITQYQPIALQDTLTIACCLGALTKTAKGLEFDILTTVKQDNKTVWESTSTNLLRKHVKDKNNKDTLEQNRSKKTRQAAFAPQQIRYWPIASNTGRRYAAISGDRNPIHLHNVSARLFGFPRAISHGMWNLANALGHLNHLLPQPDTPFQAFSVSAAFKLPIYLPCTVQFQYAEQNNRDIAFAIKDQSGEKPHLEGHVHFL